MSDIPLGRQELFHAKAESAAGTFLTPAATDAVRIKKAMLSFDQGRKDRDDKLQSRSLTERITQMKKCSWMCQTYLIPSGTAGTAPDCGKLLKAGFGVETTSGGVSVTYSLPTVTNDVEQPTSLSLYQQIGHFARGLMGAYVDKIKITLDKKNEAEIEFSGQATDGFHAGTDTVLATVTANGSNNQIATQSGMGDKYSVGGHIKIGSQATDYTITAISSDTLTLSPVLAVTATIGDAIVPFPIASTTVGSPISTILGSMTIAGATVYITKASITIDNGLTPRDDEYGRDVISGVKLGNRKVTFEFELYLRKDYLKQYGKAKRFVSQAVVFVAGTAAGKIVTITLPACEFEIPAIDGGNIEEVMLPIKGVAMATTATANDEISIVLT